jgi:hypothetical protein
VPYWTTNSQADPHPGTEMSARQWNLFKRHIDLVEKIFWFRIVVSLWFGQKTFVIEPCQQVWFFRHQPFSALRLYAPFPENTSLDNEMSSRNFRSLISEAIGTGKNCGSHLVNVVARSKDETLDVRCIDPTCFSKWWTFSIDDCTSLN